MKTFIGKITSNKMEKTVVVTVERRWRHPLYKKIVKRTKKYLAHSPQPHQIGELVKISEIKPLSKRKCWIIVEEAQRVKKPARRKAAKE